MATTRTKRILLVLVTMTLAVATAAPAMGAMRSERISKNLCLTTGGGRFVKVPGFPGERIDRRLLNDLRLLKRRYDIFLTDGYSEDPIHSVNGEHPIGLAADIVPNTAAGGTWRDISRLAKRAEPTQDQPIAPFRWVGYNGDAAHGRGHHLHLSWDHSETSPGKPARSVYTLRCPGKRTGSGDGDGGDGGGGDGTGTRDGDGSGSGGTSPGDGGDTSGGTGVSRLSAPLDSHLLDPVIETGGVDAR